MKATPLFLALLMSVTYCSAQDSIQKKPAQKITPWFVERFKVTAGLFVPVSVTDIQVSIKGGAVGTNIDFEKDLGFSQDQLTFLANFQWRISRRSRLNLNYYNIPRSATHKLDRDITFNGNTYHALATVNSFFNTAIYQVSYGYAILAKPRYELGVLIGTHLVGGKVGIAINSASVGASQSSNFGFTAPLPDLGIWGGYAFSDRWAATLDVNYLSLTVGNISGSIFAYNVVALYRLAGRFDLSLGYSGLNFKVDATKNNAVGSFKWGYNGPLFGVSYSFGKRSWGH